MSTSVVDPEKVRARLNIPFPMDNATRERVLDAIEDSESKVLTYLNRQSLAAVDQVVTALYPDAGFPLEDVRAWPEVADFFDDRYTVKSYVVNATEPDYFDVTFTVGLDVANDPALRPIQRFIIADAAASLRLDPLFTAVKRVVSSVSAEGQSVSYEKAPTAADAAGGAFTLASLKRWKRMSIGRQNARILRPWPYSDRLR